MGRKIYKYGNLEGLAISAVADLWLPGGDITWPADNAETTLLSSSVEDAVGGDGVESVRVAGIVLGPGPTYPEVIEEVVPTGQSLVTLKNEFWRVYRAWGEDVDAGTVNIGNIDIKHGATVLARIGAGDGKTLQAMYTVPDVNGRGLHITGWRICATRGALAAGVEGTLFARHPGKSWQVLDRGGTTSTGGPYEVHWGTRVHYYEPGSDVRIRVTDNAANGTFINGGIWLEVEDHER